MNKTPLAAAMGAALISSLSATVVNAEANPFAMSEMSSGYMQLAEGEMKCGASMGMAEPKTKTAEGACAGSTSSSSSSKPATAAGDKKADGSCGAKCDAGMKNCDAAKKMEGACGANMKGCGENMQGCQDMMKGLGGNCGANMKGMSGNCGGNMKMDGDKAAAPAAPAAPAK